MNQSTRAALLLATPCAQELLPRADRLLPRVQHRGQLLPCKTVFTQRLKQSGMGWEIAGGQGIVGLRVVWLSGLWDEVHQASLKAPTAALAGSGLGVTNQRAKKPA